MNVYVKKKDNKTKITSGLGTIAKKKNHAKDYGLL